MAVERRGFLKGLLALLCLPAFLPRAKAAKPKDSKPYKVAVDFHRHSVRLTSKQQQALTDQMVNRANYHGSRVGQVHFRDFSV